MVATEPVIAQVKGSSTLVQVPEGYSWMGCDDYEREAPRRRVYVPEFWMDKYPVTNDDYAEYVDSTGARKPSYWQGGRIPEGYGDHPVMVNWLNACEYARWAGKRLPTEAEWEKAAGGGQGLVFPWGDRFDADRALTWETAAVTGVHSEPVTARPQGASPYGCEQMVGLVEEWVDDVYRGYAGSGYDSIGYQQGYRVLRGGSWIFSQTHARITYRCFEDEDLSDEHFWGLGGPTFRCASTVAPQHEVRA